MDERNALPRVLNHKRGRTTFTGADQNLWFVEMPDGTIVCCSHISSAFDTCMPECMAFPAERNGNGYRVTDFEEMAVSYLSDPEEAFREVLDALMQRYKEGE